MPQLVHEYEGFAERWAGCDLLVLGPGVATGVPIRYDDPREVGPDRIANSVAARERHGTPVIVVDFGTSTNFDIVSAAGEYLGGVLAPGIEVAWTRSSPVRHACEGAVRGPRAGDRQDTTEGLQSGIVYGFVGQVDGIVSGSARSSGPRTRCRRDRRPRGADRAALADDRRSTRS